MPDNLYKRDGKYYARVQVNGRDLRKSLRTGIYAEAKKRLRKKLDELSHAKFYGEERHTWKAAVGKWTMEYLPSIKPNTAKRYLVSLGQLSSLLDERYVDEITRKKVAEIVSRRKAAAVTNATIRRDLTAMSSVLKNCMAWGWIEENPAKTYDRSVIAERRAPITLPSDQDIDLVVADCPGNLARLVRHAQYSGMREEEIGSLERTQIHEKRKQITLTETKTSRARAVPMDDRLAGTVLGTPRYLHSAVLYWHGEGVRYANIASRFAAITARVAARQKAAGKPFRRFRFHHLRHWYAVDYLKRGGNIYVLQKILGHSSIKTTELYLAYLTPEEQQRAKFGPGTETGTGATVSEGTEVYSDVH